MLDLIGAITLTTNAILMIAALSLAGAGEGRGRARLALVGLAWFVAIVIVTTTGVFTRPAGAGTLAVAAALAAPLLVAAILRGSGAVRDFVARIPLAVPIGLNVGRVIGVFFLVLHSAGRLPATFAHSAGWGDVLVGTLALPVAWAVHRRAAGWWGMAMLWNTLGTLDLITAVTLAVGSAATPLRFIFESPDSSAIAQLPWVLVPVFLVPLYLLTHATVFARL